MIALFALAAAAAVPIATIGAAQGNPKAPSPTTELSPRTREILARLDEPIPLRFPNLAPLDDVLRYIKNANKKGRNAPDFPVYIDPLGLHEAHSSLTSAVTINVEGTPLKITLQQVLGQLRLAYVVKDDVIFISSPNGVNREKKENHVAAADALPSTKSVLAKLEEPISMSFANETPLDDMLKYIRQATKKLPNDPEINILLDPNALREAGKSLNSTVQLDLEGVPLKTTLRLMLKQLDLAYAIKDGVLVISSPELIRKLRPPGTEARPTGKRAQVFRRLLAGTSRQPNRALRAVDDSPGGPAENQHGEEHADRNRAACAEKLGRPDQQSLEAAAAKS
ncbi:MAG: hypothetical protein ACLQIB_24415 [Isosphaeraceae bacterium]